jgi:DNA helicase II / ATP-dependent DNA helicase PcrA
MDFIGLLKEKHNIILNEQQMKAVLKINGSFLLNACPGSGKTTTLVARLGNMVLNHSIRPENILTMTFSKAAAHDMRERFSSIFGSELGEKMHFSTIHSFCRSILWTYYSKHRLPFPQVIEDDKAQVTKTQILKQLHLTFNNSYITDDKLEELTLGISRAKNLMMRIEDLEQLEVGINQFERIYTAYDQICRENNYIDFDHMLQHTYEALTIDPSLLANCRNRYHYLLTDESQDSSHIQNTIIKLLANPGNNIFMVGDINQSIYGFRGALPGALLEFVKTYPGGEVLYMERNYRSTQSIVTPANEFIKQNKERFDTNMHTHKEAGPPVKYTCVTDNCDQYKHVVDSLRQVKQYSSHAVLYRNNSTSIPLVDCLDRHGIPFYLRDYKALFFKHWVTHDILAFLQLALNGRDLEAYEQVYYKMNAYLSKASLEYIKSVWTGDSNIFDVLTGFPALNSKQSGKILQIKKTMNMIAVSKPAIAIELIESALEYSEYLKRKGMESKYSGEPLDQILGALKNIAFHTQTIAEFKQRLEDLQTIMEGAKRNKGKNAVTLSTCHGSKGLEWDHCFIIGLYEGEFPSAKAIEELDMGFRQLYEEEVRLFYVSVTRARHSLELLSAKQCNGTRMMPSRFIAKLLDGYPKAGKEKALTVELNSKEVNYKILEGVGTNDIREGSTVCHVKYGLGYVKRMEKDDDIMDVVFTNHGQKTLSKKMCLLTNLLKPVEIIK